MISYDILHRATGSVVFRAEIDCNDNASDSVMLGLAVQAALKAEARLEWADLRGATLDGATLDGADLYNANLDRATLREASLEGATLCGASLCGTNLDFADLCGADLVGASLVGASLVGATLDGADLDFANLDFANLDGATLDRATLVGASLEGATLVGASLEGANLDGATLVRTKWGFARPTAIVSRINDHCQFALWRSLWGGHAVKAGPHLYSISDYRAHVAREYPGTDKATETLAILNYLESRMAVANI